MIYGYIIALISMILGVFLLSFIAPYAEGDGMMTLAQILMWGSVGLALLQLSEGMYVCENL